MHNTCREGLLASVFRCVTPTRTAGHTLSADLAACTEHPLATTFAAQGRADDLKFAIGTL
jgi:hypothetical protein